MKDVAALRWPFLLLVLCPVDALSQNSISPQQLLITASQAFAGKVAVSSATLTGQATRIVGPSSENGQITLIARADGSSSVDLVLPSGTRAESQSAFSNGQTCAWSGSDGIVQNTPAHNCMIPVAWFLPEVALFSSQQTTLGSFIGAMDGGTSEISLLWSLSPPAGADSGTAALLTHIGAYNLQFTASSSLLKSLAYSIHPDNNAGTDIPVTVLYSDYRTINGTAIPFRIQRYVNGVLSLDLSLNNAVVTH